VVLTAITAEYGLRFNRAGVLLFDESGERLIGQLGIGHLTRAEAEKAWEGSITNFHQYLVLLEAGQLPSTPLAEKIREFQLDFQPTNHDAFSRAVLLKQADNIAPSRQQELPAKFREFWRTTKSTLAIVPLVARAHCLGLLLVDNEFTETGVTTEDCEWLWAFANAMAIAIDNIRLLEEKQTGLRRLSALNRASNALISGEHPREGSGAHCQGDA
jgi:transcriptional regulator with GAF, ATPase, and Fis domain